MKRLALIGLMSLSITAGLMTAPLYAEQAQNKAANEASEKKTTHGSEVVLSVNEKEFTDEDVKTEISKLMPSMSYHTSASDKKLVEIRTAAVNRLIDRELMYEYAKKNKIGEATKTELTDALDKIKKAIPENETLGSVLKRSKMTLAELKEDIKANIITDKLIIIKRDAAKKKADDLITDAYILDYYQKNLPKFVEPEQLRISGILLKADPSGGQKQWNEIRGKSAELQKRAMAGEDFAKLAEKYSEDPYASRGGDMGWAHKGSLQAELEDAASKMKTGEISEPIMTIYGYHIIKMVDKKASEQKKLEDLNKDKLKKELAAAEYKKLWDGWIKELRDAAKIEYLDPDLAREAKEAKEARDAKEANVPK